MLELRPDIEEKIEAIHFYYSNKEKIARCKHLIEQHKVRIQELENQITRLQNKINEELVGEYKESIEFGIEDGKPYSKIVNKKTRKGILEKLIPFLCEKDEKTAINKFFVSKGGRENQVKEIPDIDDFYIGTNEYDPVVRSQENLSN